MKMLELLEQLEDLIETAGSIPFTGKCNVNREEVMGLIRDIRVVMPDEVKQAKWIKDERTKIITDAQQEAERLIRSAHNEANIIIAEAQDRVEKLVHKDEIVKQARVKGQELVDTANMQATEIKSGAYRYADEMMQKLELHFEKHYDAIKRNRMELEKYQQKSQG